MYRRESNYLFSEGDLDSTLRARRTQAVESVKSIPRDQFLASSIDTLVEHIVDKYSIVPLVLYEDQMSMDSAETQIDVTGRFDYDIGRGGRVTTAGHQLTFYIPFTGESQLWQLRPNMWLSMMPSADVDTRTSRLTITLKNTSNADPETYKNELNSRLNGIRQLIASQNQLLQAYQSQLPNEVRTAVQRRRAEIEQLQGLAAAFDIPLVRKEGMPEFKPIEVAKKVSRPLPRPPAVGYKPEPAITTELYEDILSIIRHAGISFEGAPQTYKPLGEEGLRDNVLSHLNAIFEGRATGETFRKYGKTDIRIEEETRSAFVGECKLWGGEKVLLEALTQLLGYVTWRDCKAALVMFNKDVAGFSGTQETIAKALPSHPNFIREKPTNRIGEWRYVFKSAEDPNQEVTVHVFAFNLYVAPDRAGKKR